MLSMAQQALVSRLLAERVIPASLMDELNENAASMTPGQFSKAGTIKKMLACERKNGHAKKAYAPAAKSAPKPELAEGIYVHDGQAYRVKVSKTSHKPYAAVLDLATGKFEYVPGAIRALPAGIETVGIDEALAFGLKHGMCVNGHLLTNPLSIKLGIGPKCCENMYGMTLPQLAKQREAALV